MGVGVIELYYSFLKRLKNNKEKIAPLQLVGKIEDYLVKEFVYHIYTESNGEAFALTNLGIKEDKRRIDICLIRNDVKKPIIYGMIEVKYLRNRQRLSYGDAKDEICTSLKSLYNQIGPFNKTEYGGFDVQLYAKSKCMYGLVFASFIAENYGDKVKKEEFYNEKILKKAENIGFRYHDLKKPYFRRVFEDEPVNVLSTKYYVTLRAGLWKRGN